MDKILLLAKVAGLFFLREWKQHLANLLLVSSTYYLQLEVTLKFKEKLYFKEKYLCTTLKFTLYMHGLVLK